MGTLYVCATPIGNLEDISLRVLRILREVDIIACEDTRHSLKLLNHYGISKPLISLHEHNERSKSEAITALLDDGKDVALISDAGMPGIQDPGYLVIQKMIETSRPYVILPGASALITAVVGSNLVEQCFTFLGFLPGKEKERQAFLTKHVWEEQPLVFYESPHRLLKSLKDCFCILGDRKVVLAKELTKTHERYIRGTLSEITSRFHSEPIKGEWVVVVSGAPHATEEEAQNEQMEEQFLALRDLGYRNADCIKILKRLFGYSKNTLYDLSLLLRKKEENE